MATSGAFVRLNRDVCVNFVFSCLLLLFIIIIFHRCNWGNNYTSWFVQFFSLLDFSNSIFLAQWPLRLIFSKQNIWSSKRLYVERVFFLSRHYYLQAHFFLFIVRCLFFERQPDTGNYFAKSVICFIDRALLFFSPGCFSSCSFHREPCCRFGL